MSGCKGCAERRQIIKTAYREQGISGAVASIPRVIKHTIRREDTRRVKPTGK